MTKLAAIALVAFAAGCLDPLVSDDVPLPGLVLPSGSSVPDAHDDLTVDAQIADYDGVDAEIPLLWGFGGGSSVGYWNFGDTPTFAAPLFVLVGSNGEPIGHNTIIETIPGDSGYSPYWAVFTVEITEQYNGEILPSVAAVQQAVELGLIGEPELQDFAVNCPAVAANVTLQVGGGNDPIPPPQRFYWQGKTVRYYDFGIIPLVDGAVVPESPVYVLRREGEEPLSEPIRGIDMTGDGDTNDTNNLFTTNLEDDDYSPLCRTVTVAVPSAYASIDTSMNQLIADFRDSADVFDPDPVPGNVVAFEETDQMRNCPQQVAVGSL